MNYIKAITLFVFILFAIPNIGLGQTEKYSLGIKKSVKSIRYDAYYFLFFPIDSIYKKGKLVPSVEKEITKLYTFLSKKDYYLIQLGYYILDTSYQYISEKAFYDVKKSLEKVKSNKLIKKDMVCSSSNMASYRDVYRYQKLMNVKIENCIVFSILKTREKIIKYDVRDCYF